MGKALSPLVKQELANLNKDPDRRRTSMNVLKTYVELLDTKSIPLFLAEVSDFKQSKASRQHAISLYEVLARTHGKNIVPHIGKIMGTVVKALCSSAGSLPLQQACARVVLSIARYAIDPLSTDTQREDIIRGLCSPLLNVLMGKGQPLGAGAALCLQALVESDSWKFASTDTVNELCTRVTGALEEKGTQTAAHMSLVCSLVKLNSQILEAYGRALIKAGIKMLEDGVSNESWQQCVDALQMINSLLKSVGIGILGYELRSIVDYLDKCGLDKVPYVRDVVAETLQTAKIKVSEKGLTDLVRMPSFKLSPSHKFQRRRSLWCESDPSCGSSKTPTYGSQESYVVSYTPSSVSSGGSLDNELCSSPSMQSDAGQQDYRISEYGVNKMWKQMEFENGGVDISLKDGILFMNARECDAQHGRNGESKQIWSHINFQNHHEDNLKDTESVRSSDFHGFEQYDTTNGDVSAYKSWKPTTVSDTDTIQREHAQKEAEKDVPTQKSSFLRTSIFGWSRQPNPIEHTVTHQAVNEHKDDEYETSSESGWPEMDDLVCNSNDHVLSNLAEGDANFAPKSGGLLPYFESVGDKVSNGNNALDGSSEEGSSLWSSSGHGSNILSSSFSTSLHVDEKKELKLKGSKPMNHLQQYNDSIHRREANLMTFFKRVASSILPAKAERAGGNCIRWKKTKSYVQLTLRGFFILGMLFFPAALMAAKSLSMQEDYQLLVPT
ncbi:protein SINE1 isoform X2 [Cryptomeria japonica]|uniref:protein SINE1 isoform X2 n=1 Tax=Cryptomeria japonica TaxID=3369 RepID=UPI0025AC7FAF|nr:protein SINE1 isoform X2 [Cryptomeria japonica]